MEGCIFCKVVEGKIPCAKIYEDEKVISFLDISPNNKGHCLVVPKRHSANFLDMAPDDLAGTMSAAQKIAKAVSKSLNADFNIVINSGKEAGQAVFHAHLHIIPRFRDDGIKFEARHLKYEGNEMSEYAGKIKENLQ